MINFKSWNADEEDEETWVASFSHRTDDMGDYLNSKGSEEDMLEIGSSAQIKVTVQGDTVSYTHLTLPTKRIV